MDYATTNLLFIFSLMSRSTPAPTIAKAEIFRLRYTLPGYKLSYGTINEVFPILLKLTDAEGNVGWGEANPQPPFTEENAEDVVRVLQEELLPAVIGYDSPESESIDLMLDNIRPEKHLMAKGAITVALLDLKGRRLNVPVADLLGKVLRSSLQVSYPLSNGTAQDDIAIVDAQRKEGYIDYMLKMGDGSHSVDEEIQRVEILEKRYGQNIRFKADPNTGWTVKEAIEFIKGVKGTSLAFIEQPIDKHDFDGLASLAKIAKAAGQKLSVDESLTGMASAKEIVAKGAAQVFSVKTSKNGGPLRARAIAKLAEENDIRCYSNSMLEGGIMQAASLHLAVTLPNLLDIGHSFRSVLRLEGDVTDFASNIRNGMVYLPEGPGLGIQVDENRVRSGCLETYVVQ